MHCWYITNPVFLVCEEGPGLCAHLLTAVSLLIIATTLPLSLVMVIKVVQVIILLIMHDNYPGLHIMLCMILIMDYCEKTVHDINPRLLY